MQHYNILTSLRSAGGYHAFVNSGTIQKPLSKSPVGTTLPLAIKVMCSGI